VSGPPLYGLFVQAARGTIVFFIALGRLFLPWILLLLLAGVFHPAALLVLAGTLCRVTLLLLPALTLSTLLIVVIAIHVSLLIEG
jgi:hypothetical protein